MSKRIKPENWYAFSEIDCELFSRGINDMGVNNMRPPSQQYYCKRKDRTGRQRPYWIGDRCYELLKCNWRVCPKLKQKPEPVKKRGGCET